MAVANICTARRHAHFDSLDRNPLDLVERTLILPAVVKLRRSRRLVVGARLLQACPCSSQVRGDAGRPEGMVPDLRLDASAARPPRDHAVGVMLPHGLDDERASLLPAVWNKGVSGSPPFPHIRTWDFGADARSGQGRAFFARSSERSETLDGEDGPHTLVS